MSPDPPRTPPLTASSKAPLDGARLANHFEGRAAEASIIVHQQFETWPQAVDRAYHLGRQQAFNEAARMIREECS